MILHFQSRTLNHMVLTLILNLSQNIVPAAIKYRVSIVMLNHCYKKSINTLSKDKNNCSLNIQIRVNSFRIYRNNLKNLSQYEIGAF